MDFSWSNFSGLWIFPLLCLVFMVVMMIGGRCTPFRFGHGHRTGHHRDTAHEIVDRRYATGEIEEHDAMRRIEQHGSRPNRVAR